MSHRRLRQHGQHELAHVVGPGQREGFLSQPAAAPQVELPDGGLDPGHCVRRDARARGRPARAERGWPARPTRPRRTRRPRRGRAAARHTWSMSSSTPGSSASERAATAPLPRSAASAYCVRSLVPMLTKSRCGRKVSIFNAAAGISTIMPTRRPSGSPDGPAASASTWRASSSSPSVATIGNMTLVGDRRAVWQIATSWSRRRSRWSRLSRIPRCPRNGFASSGIGR